jgi:hypothetical protein
MMAADTTKTIEIIVDTREGVKSTDKLTKSLKETEEQTKDTQQEAKKYDKQLKESSETTSKMSDKLDEMTGGWLSNVKGIKAAVKGLKTFKIALAATGIGAIIVAVGTLTAAFKNLQGPMSFLEDLTAGIGAAFDQALKSLNIFGQAALKFFKGDLVGAIALTKVGIDNIGKAFQEGSELSKGQREFELRQARILLLLSQQERQIEQLKLTAEDQTKTQQVRLEAANKAFELQNARVAGLIQLERDRIALGREQLELSTQTDQDKIDFLNLQTEGNEKIATLEGQLVELSNSRNAIIKELTTSQQKLNDVTDDYAEDVLDYFEASTDAVTEFSDAALKAADEMAAANDVMIETSETATEDQNKLNDALGVTTQAATGLLDVFQGKVQGKDIFKTVLKTLSGILSIVLPGSGAAIGGISSLLGGLFADGGYTKKGGKYEPAGIVHAGEWVANQELVNNPVTGPIIQALEEMRTGLKGYADGGFVASQTSQEAQIAQLAQTFQQQQIVLPIEDLRTVNTRVVVTEDRATL